jgi:hypothetical protein
VPITWLLLSFALALPAREGSSPSDDTMATRSGAVVTGPWGGPHIALDATGDGGAIEYDCAHGQIAEPLRLDAEGRFRAKGTHSPEHGGPAREGERPVRRAATYSGTVEGKRMRLTVTLADPSETFGTFELTAGGDPELVKCR